MLKVQVRALSETWGTGEVGEGTDVSCFLR